MKFFALDQTPFIVGVHSISPDQTSERFLASIKANTDYGLLPLHMYSKSIGLKNILNNDPYMFSYVTQYGNSLIRTAVLEVKKRRNRGVNKIVC